MKKATAKAAAGKGSGRGMYRALYTTDQEAQQARAEISGSAWRVYDPAQAYSIAADQDQAQAIAAVYDIFGM